MTEDRTTPDGPETTGRDRAARRRRPGIRHVLWLVVSSVFVVIFVSGALVAGMMMSGEPLVAPGWMRERIKARLDTSLSGLDVEFGEIALILGENGTPRLRLGDLRVSREGSAARLTLSDIEGTVALGPLLEGRVQPDSIYLTGAQMRLRRDAEGGFDLALSETGAGGATRQATGDDMGALADQIELLLDTPGLRELKRIEATALTLRYEDARSGRAWTVDGGRVVMTRRGEDLELRGDFALLGGRAWASTLTVSYASRIGDKAARFGMNFEDMAAEDLATQSAALAWLGALDAPVSGAMRVETDREGRLGPMSVTLQSRDGALQPSPGTRPIPFNEARSYFTFDPARQALTFDEFWFDSRYLTVRAEGGVRLIGTEGGRPAEMVGQMRVSEFTARSEEMLPEPLRFDDVRADMRLVLEPFRLTVGQLSLGHAGERIAISGEVRASDEGWDVTAEARRDRVTPEVLLALWPQTFGQKTKAWMEQNVFAGALSNVQAALRLTPGGRPDVFLGFDFDGVEMTLLKGMPHGKEMRGHASLLRNRFVAVVEDGHVVAPQGGKVSLKGTEFVVLDNRIKPAPAELKVETEGTITATLSLLDQPPLQMMQKAGRPVTMADGRMRLTARSNFILKKGQKPTDFPIAVTGVLSDLRSDLLVPGRTIAASRMDLSLKDDMLAIAGQGRIGAVPFDGRYEAGIGARSDGTGRWQGKVELSERFVDEFRIGLPPGALSGQGSAELTVDLKKGEAPRFRLDSDLSGVGLALADVKWSKPRSSAGRLSVSGALASPPRIESVAVEVPGLVAKGRVEMTPQGTLAAARFDRVRIGDWLDAPVVMRGRGAGRSPAIEIAGGRVDMRRLDFGSGGSGKGTPMTLALDQLQISDTIALMDFRGQFDTTGGMSGRFSGKVNGLAEIAGAVVPQGKRSAVRITAQDAGRVLAAMKLLKAGREGAMDLTLTPVGGEGTYDGVLRVNGLRITEAPAMAELLSAISVVGLLEQLSGKGIVFNDIDARFRLTPRQLIVAESSAVGASLGISMDGVYDFARGLMDMQGVVSPIYVVNGIGSLFTRKGEGLFGFSYTVRGAAADPSVSVNPLSVLTPGMFRDIFRRPPPQLSQAPSQ
ncbi:hypothetical protein ATO6_15865 [Oceanicola sp. 22II-s10i]|uniref:AsmA-like C-terminal region-containing protein n=1 Tax=Oceanicola sp. 22II-s10i TaxID=1317116 RepID=UPI000B52473E|nr:AsmA-like C-terminal region-containing protein [Oceanicola sp. 22II-s10i]OWU83893.1 hypothetical protein ATO6_15865 [Oceanicola sp. 22II-s10i]